MGLFGRVTKHVDPTLAPFDVPVQRGMWMLESSDNEVNHVRQRTPMS